MDSSRWNLPLPKTYRPSLLLKISLSSVGLFCIFMLLAAFTAVLIGLITGQISFGLPFLLASICVCLLSPFAILACCMYVFNLFWMQLKLVQEGILFITLGQRLFTPWSNIISFRNHRTIPEMELQQAAEKISVKEGLRRKIAAQEVAWWYTWWIGRRSTYFISVPHISGMAAWDTSEMELYVRKYAPQAFHQGKIAKA